MIEKEREGTRAEANMRGSQDQAEPYSAGSGGRSDFDAFGEWMSSRWHIGVIPARPAPMALHAPWRVPLSHAAPPQDHSARLSSPR